MAQVITHLTVKMPKARVFALRALLPLLYMIPSDSFRQRVFDSALQWVQRGMRVSAEYAEAKS